MKSSFAKIWLVDLKETFYTHFQIGLPLDLHALALKKNIGFLVLSGAAGHGDIVWCHKVTELKVRLLTRRFRSGCFLWENGASVLAFKIIYMRKNTEGKEHILKA